MYPFAQSSDDPPLAWSHEAARAEAKPVSMLRRLANAAKGRKGKDDEKDDDDDMPGPNAVATLFPFLTLRLARPAMA
jgi:hypothetical protein